MIILTRKTQNKMDGKSVMHVQDIPALSKMSTSEKIMLIEEMWDSIVESDEASVPVPESHKMELVRRNKRYASHIGSLLTLDELKAKIESRK
jgi:putative addiction module component (TIGR02574 family)